MRKSNWGLTKQPADEEAETVDGGEAQCIELTRESSESSCRSWGKIKQVTSWNTKSHIRKQH